MYLRTCLMRLNIASRRQTVLQAVSRLPDWAVILLLTMAGRAVSTAWLILAYSFGRQYQPDKANWTAPNGFLQFLNGWDGQYYRQIAEHGYPAILPFDASGHVMQNPWAFLPAFPYVVRSVSAITGMSFEVIAPISALALSVVAAFLLHRLVRLQTGQASARWAVFLFTCGPLSFVLEVGYAEAMFLVLAFGALLAIERHRFALVAALGFAASFTRPGALALALTFGVVAVVRGLRSRCMIDAGSGRLGVREIFSICSVAGVLIIAGFTWPVVAGLVTGQPDAYLATEMSWWVNFIGRVNFVPLTPWFITAGKWGGIGGVALVISMIIGFNLWVTRKSTRKLGLTIVVFAISYAAFVFAVSLPMASTPRLLLPLSPLLGSPALTTNRWARMTLVTAALVGQPIMVVALWLLGPP